MREETQSGSMNFRPRARLLKLIGSELISDEIVALTELVKNAHDADASVVRLEFLGVTGHEGEILVRDDGHGMDFDTLMNRWMQPAASDKGREGRRLTLNGRRVLGEKGVGRFAADKIGAHLELVSRPKNAASEIHAVFDWDEFEHDDRMLSEVHSRWEVRPPDWIEYQGTVLRMTGLRVRWTERLFKRLSSRLSRLISPFGKGNRGFRIVIESDEFPDYSGEVSASSLEQAPYSIDAEFDGQGSLRVAVGGGAPVVHPWTDSPPLRCGPVRVRLFAFDLETEALARIGPRAEVRAWLKEWSGISVYRDDFRLWPYGEPHDDWLRLDHRRVNNPMVRLSNNQIVGFVAIGIDKNPDLRDQTNREGLIHNEAFSDLQRLVLQVMTILEAERQTLRHPDDRNRRRPPAAQDRPEDGGDGVTESLEKLARQTDGPIGNEIRRVARQVRKRLETQESQHRKTLEGYAGMAALGHVASLTSRNINLGLEAMRLRMADLRNALERGRGADPSVLAGTLAELQSRTERLLDQVAHVSPAAPGAAKRRRAIDVPCELRRLRDNLLATMEAEDVDIEIRASEGLLRTEMRPENFAALFSVLMRNSLEWRKEGVALKMVVSVEESGGNIEILFSDDGKGVAPTMEEHLLEPGVSGSDRAGMGLTIARNIATEHGGDLSYVKDEQRSGATFCVRLPRKRSRATVAERSELNR